MKTRIALIHAVAVAMAPIEQAFRNLWPEAERMNLLDDTLSVDRAKDPDLTAAMTGRVATLADYVRANGAGAILFTCSAFGPAIEAVAARSAIPVLKPNEAMFEAALAKGDRIGMVATFEPSVASMAEEFEVQAKQFGRSARLETVCVPEAMAALRNGDAARHNELVAAAAGRLAHCDAIMLAQFSTSVAADAVRSAVHAPVLTSPDAAVGKLKDICRSRGR